MPGFLAVSQRVLAANVLADPRELGGVRHTYALHSSEVTDLQSPPQPLPHINMRCPIAQHMLYCTH
jgi:hypothetical protein